jgi:hypothetical protein
MGFYLNVNTMTFKIAIIYSGHLRTLSKTSESHRMLFEALRAKGCEVNVFCQTWGTLESDTASWWKPNAHNEPLRDNEIEERLCEYLSPTAHSIIRELPIPTAPTCYRALIPYEGVYSMYFGEFTACELYDAFSKETGWVADYVLKLRYDVVIDNESLSETLIRGLQSDACVYSSKFYSFLGACSDVSWVIKQEFIMLANGLKFFLDENTLSKYFQKYNLFVPELFLSDFVFSGLSTCRLQGQLGILRLSGDFIEISPNGGVSNAVAVQNLDSLLSICATQEQFLAKARAFISKVGRDEVAFLYAPALRLTDCCRILALGYRFRGSEDDMTLLSKSVEFCLKNKSTRSVPHRLLRLTWKLVSSWC